MRFSKYNNPSKKHPVRRKTVYSDEYVEARRQELYGLLAETDDEEGKQILIDAFRVSIDP